MTSFVYAKTEITPELQQIYYYTSIKSILISGKCTFLNLK